MDKPEHIVYQSDTHTDTHWDSHLNAGKLLVKENKGFFFLSTQHHILGVSGFKKCKYFLPLETLTRQNYMEKESSCLSRIIE